MKGAILILLLAGNLCYAQKPAKYATTIQQQVWSITEVMYHDVINPPAAARFYSYSVLTGDQILGVLDPSYISLKSVFKNYPAINTTFDRAKVNTEVAVLYGILETGKNIIPSGYLLEEKQKQLLAAFTKKKISKVILDSSVAFAKRIAMQVVQYSRSDGYFKLSTLARYTPYEAEGMWRPTPPEYMAAVEPHWRTIRTFLIDSSGQFSPVAFTAFNKDSASSFYQQAYEVYDVSRKLTSEQKLIANFWDCNPFAVQFQGHMSIGLKKISPGGHWMGIAGICSKKANLDFKKTLFLHTLTALTLHDAFISCWDAKYSTNRVRPETAINRYIDQRWKPLLQTPPFPEYPSGHSVISTAVAEVLTHFLGDKFQFTDTVETYIGLPSRKFSSFREAAAEARISRLYGGIHFRDGIEAGGEEGRLIGEYVVRKLQMKPF